MKEPRKKLYLVKREVRANSIEEAIRKELHGKIYCIELADDKFQPPETEKPIGFNAI